MSKKAFSIKTKDGIFKVYIWFDRGDRAYLVKGVSLPAVTTFGKNLQEAKKMAREALELFCNCAVEENKIVVDDKGKAIGKLPKSRVIEPAR